MLLSSFLPGLRFPLISQNYDFADPRKNYIPFSMIVNLVQYGPVAVQHRPWQLVPQVIVWVLVAVVFAGVRWCCKRRHSVRSSAPVNAAAAVRDYRSTPSAPATDEMTAALADKNTAVLPMGSIKYIYRGLLVSSAVTCAWWIYCLFSAYRPRYAPDKHGSMGSTHPAPWHTLLIWFIFGTAEVLSALHPDGRVVSAVADDESTLLSC